MAFKIFFHLTMLANDTFEMVVFEEKTLETFQIVRHLNNTPLSKFIFIKYTSTSQPKRLQGSPHSCPPQRNFILLRVSFFFLVPVLRSPMPTIIYALTWLMPTYQCAEKYFMYFGEIMPYIRLTKLKVHRSSYLLCGKYLRLNFHTKILKVVVVREKSFAKSLPPR